MSDVWDGDPKKDPEEKFYKLHEVEEMLSVSRATLKRWIYRGKIRAVKLGIPESEWKDNAGVPWRISASALAEFKRTYGGGE